MTRALVAAAKAKCHAVLDGLRLDPDEVVRVGIDLAVQNLNRAGLDRRGLLALVDDALAAHAVEGGGGAK